MLNGLINDIFDGEGNAQEKLYRIYGKKLNYSNASKYLSGIKLHLNKIKEIADNDIFQEETEETKEVSFNKDKTKTIKAEVYLTSDEAASPVKIMKKMGLDPFLWEIVTCKITDGSWDVTLKLVNSEIVNNQIKKKSSREITFIPPAQFQKCGSLSIL